MTEFDLGNRHGRSVPGLSDEPTPLSVRVVAGAVTGKPAAAHTLVCLINLLCRLKGSVTRIVLEVDGYIGVAMPHEQPGGDALAAMQSLAQWATDGEIPVVAEGPTDITIHIGDALERPGAHIYAYGEGWRAWVGSRPASFGRAPETAGGLGPYLAAALAVGELFKKSRRLQNGRFAEDFAYSLWSGEASLWDVLTDGPNLNDVSLPPLYLVGAGAVGQGLVQVLGTCSPRSTYIVTIDHDLHDPEGTNLNRCFLAGIGDRNHAKTDVVRRYRELTAMGGIEFSERLGEYALHLPHLRLPAVLAERETRDEFDVVVSAVDVNDARQSIQGLRPRIIVGGSTDGLRAQSNVYRSEPDTECLACRSSPDPTSVRSEEALRAMTEEQRRTQLHGAPNIEPMLSYLREGGPGCGELGEADLKHFLSTTAEFSVSFVSMAAAVFAAARLIAEAALHDPWSGRANATVFQFKNLKAEDVRFSARPGCPYCHGTGVARL